MYMQSSVPLWPNSLATMLWWTNCTFASFALLSKGVSPVPVNGWGGLLQCMYIISSATYQPAVAFVYT